MKRGWNCIFLAFVPFKRECHGIHTSPFFICSLFNDTDSRQVWKESNDRITEYWIVNNIEGSSSLIHGTIPTLSCGDWGQQWKTFQDGQSPDWDLKTGPPIYEAGVLTTGPRQLNTPPIVTIHNTIAAGSSVTYTIVFISKKRMVLVVSILFNNLQDSGSCIIWYNFTEPPSTYNLLKTFLKFIYIIFYMCN
jgi:hypothetical protein